MEILKLGGSIITYKDKPFTIHKENIKRITKEIAKSGSRHLIIVHGGGSYGHVAAKEYNIQEGFSQRRQLIGFSRTRQAMISLNNILIDALLNEKVPAVSINPSSFIITDQKRMKTINFEVIKRFIEKGFIPVLYGDAVLDDYQGLAILSGDQLVSNLALELEASRIIFGLDVDGVFTANPKIVEDARLIKSFSLSKMKGVVKKGDILNSDVTEGMFGKIKEAAPAVERGIEVILVNAGIPNRIYKALIREPIICTSLIR
jgi:isopentenyl phosphate kinase